MKRNSPLLYAIVTLSTFVASAPAQTTLVASPTATAYYGGALVNFRNDSADTLRLTGRFGLNTGNLGPNTSGLTNTYRVYSKGSALSGQELTGAGWSVLGDAIATTLPQGTFTPINVGATLDVAPGATIGLAFFLATGADSAGDFPAGGYIGYASGANTYTDGAATITSGLAKAYRGAANPTPDDISNQMTFSPRAWSGSIEYAPVAPVPEPVALAALGAGLVGLVSRRRSRR